jgi:hypothetical protein
MYAKEMTESSFRLSKLHYFKVYFSLHFRFTNKEGQYSDILYAALSSFSISTFILVLLLRRDSTLLLYASLLSSWTHHIIFVSVLHSMLVTCSCVSFFTLPVHFLKPIVDTLSAVEHMDSDHTLQQTALRFLCKRVESNS